MNDRLFSKAGPEVAMLHALIRGLCEQLGMDNRSLESQEMKQVPSSQKTVTDESSEHLMIDLKGRYHMSSSATKKLAECINQLSPHKSVSGQTNDEKVVCENSSINSE